MFRFTASVSTALLFSLIAVGCSSSSDDAGVVQPVTMTPTMMPPVEEHPAPTCPTVCPGDQTCRDNTCQDPTPRQVAQAMSVSSLVDQLADGSGWHEAVDRAAVKTRVTKEILRGDGTDLTYFSAAWHAMNSYPQGHQAMASNDASVCGKTIPYQQNSRFGVCGRPSGDGIAVTAVRAGNLLGLKAGDTVVAAGADMGDAMFDASYGRPVCGDVFPAASGRRYEAAASFFGTVPAGMVLTVRAPDGTMRKVTIPAKGDAQSTDCTDPFSRNRAIYAEATTRPDGVAVIRLPSFYPFDKQLPANATDADYEAFIAAYQAEIVKVFESVKTAPAIIWEARGNTGGISAVGLAIVGGFASARQTSVSYCRDRIASSSPIAYQTTRYAEYSVTPGGPFAYAGKVAVLIDGLAYSAGDYFPRAVATASDAPIVGSAAAGAYGGGRSPIALDGPPSIAANFDPVGCFDATTNAPLEGSPLPPKVAVEYDAKDLAAGKDTILERAVTELAL